MPTAEDLECHADLIEVFKELIVVKITDYVQEYTETDLQEIVSNVVNKADSEIILDYIKETSEFFEEIVWDNIEDEISTKIEEKLTDCSALLNIDTDDFSTKNIKYNFAISDTIMTVLQEDTDYNDDDRRDSIESKYSEVVNMFER